MKKFKDFVKSKKSGVSRIPQPHEMYVAVIHHGSHSQVNDKSSSSSSSGKKKKKITEQQYDDDYYDMYDNLTNEVHGIKDTNTEPLFKELIQHPSIDTNNNPFADQLKNYTNSSLNANRILYQHHLDGKYGDDGYHPDMLRNIVKDGRINLARLDHAIHHGSAPNDLTVFSGLKWIPPEISGGKPNKIFLPSFTSTTLNANITTGFSNEFRGDKEDGDRPSLTAHIAMFKIPKGSPMAIPGHRYSVYPEEHEVVLPRGIITEWGKPEERSVLEYDPYNDENTRRKILIHPVDIKDVTVHPRNFKPIT